MLRHGLGRAVLFLRNQPDTTHYRSIVWGACSENWSFDSQLEDERSPYLFDVIHATGEPLYYAERLAEVLDTFGTSRESKNLFRAQLIRFATLLTRNGTSDLRESLYRAIGTISSETYGITNISEEIIALDGVAGYWFLVELLLQNTERDDDRWDEILLLDSLSEHLGESATDEILDASVVDHPKRKRYLCEIRRVWQREKAETTLRQKQREKQHLPTLSDVQAYIDSPPTVRMPKPQISRMNEAIRTRLLADFAEETDRGRQLRYLQILRTLRDQPFPGDLEIVLPLIWQTDDERMAWQAVRLLEHTSHPTIRAAALRLLSQKNRMPHGLELLVKNPGDGDVAILERVMREEWDDYMFHTVGMGVRDYIKSHSVPGSVSILLDCYERMACSFCRRIIVETLLERDALPITLREECYFDTDSDTRDLFRSISRQG